MGNLKDWFRIFRAQTYPASLMLIMIFYLLAGGKLFSLYALYLAIFALLAHYFGFGHNSLMDSCRVPKIGELPYDAQDKNKQHHPLVSGKISLEKAHKVIHTGLILTFLLGIVLVWFSSGNHFYAMISLTFYMVFGMAYNNGLDKAIYHDYLIISTCFTFFGLYGYFLVANSINLIVILLAVYVWLLEWFENNVEGSLKEIETKSEKNIMKLLGCRVKDNYLKIPLIAKAYGSSVKLSSIFVLWYILYLEIYQENLLFAISFLLSMIILMLVLYFALIILSDKTYNRNGMLKLFSTEEILSIYAPYFVLMPLIGVLPLILLPIGIVYFLGINKINWGVFFPKV